MVRVPCGVSLSHTSVRGVENGNPFAAHVQRHLLVCMSLSLQIHRVICIILYGLPNRFEWRRQALYNKPGMSVDVITD